jgi:hypothetical protein
VNFLNPLFLIGLAGAAVPLLIHLLTRRRPRRQEFSSVEFLREAQVVEMRRFRLREWILLALRMLAVACLALAVSRPVWRAAAAGGGSTAVVLLVDRSLSLRAREGEETLFDRARGLALSVLEALEPEDRVQVVAFDEAAEALFPEPVEDHGRARAALAGLEPTARGTDLEAAVARGLEILAATPAVHRELYLLTDAQKSGLSEAPAPRRTVPGLRFRIVPVSAETSPMNRAVRRARFRPGEPASVEVEVSRYGEGNQAPDAEVPLAAYALVEAGLWREAGRGFVSGEAGGLLILSQKLGFGGRVEIADDALLEDNARAFPGGGVGAVRAGVVSRGRALPLVLETGAEAGIFRARRLETSQLTSRHLAGLDVLVLDDVASLADGALAAVVDFARAGGGLVLVLGPAVDPAFWNARLLPALGDWQIEGDAPVRAGAGWSLKRAAVGHPALRGFAPGAGENLSQAVFRAAWRLDPGQEGRVLARFGGELAAVVERENVLLFASDAGGEWSDFLVSGAFLPFWLQAIEYLSSGNSADLVPGERLDLPVPPGEGEAAWTLRAPSGLEIPLSTRLAGGLPRLLSPPLEELGLHLLEANGRPVRAVAVTPRAAESDLARLSPAEAERRWASLGARALAPDAEIGRAVREARFGRELWRELLIAALLLLVAETILARLWGARRVAEEEAVFETETARVPGGGRR